MKTDERLTALIKLIIEFIESETWREVNSDGGHWQFLNELDKLLKD